ncbi:MAG: hypothetical protein ACW98Y_05640 [Candidatus Thorarchaeota archaeon]|jgi:hypothetical protein
MENKTAFLLLLIGGIILFLEGITGSIGFFSYLPMILAIPELVPLEPIIFYLIWILTIIAASGGIGVIVGALLISRSREGTGKFIVGIAVGMSLIGLIIKLIQLIWLSGVTAAYDFLVIAAQTMGWIGVFLTIAGRRMV